ncbi:MAG: molybdopterin-dependent oxidoreductase [Acidimicrobiia bacterium]|nr:molybdopterin-dependent oxidoreductase [Acidimicrobiia bacterium]
MPGSILGNAVRRVEDPDLLTGRGTYLANLRLPGLLHVAFVRSPVAHAAIRSIDAAEAVAMPGVVAVYTAADLGLSPHHGFVGLADTFLRPPLATDRARFVGEAVAAVVAESKAAAVDAVDAVIVDYDPLPIVADAEAALTPGAPVLFEALGSNLAFSLGDAAADGFFDDAEVVVRGRFVNQRVAVVPMEGNACVAVPGDDGRLTFHAATQMPHGLHGALAEELGFDPAEVRVVAPHVGGGFGGKVGLYHEFTVTAAAALRLDRPVAWIEGRSEDMVSLAHGRGQVHYAELGLRGDGRFTGLRVRLVGDGGAYPGVGAMLTNLTRMMSQGVYDLPKISFDIAVAATNTTPIGAYRGAGRPEAASLVERIVDMGAAELGLDPAELRRRNFIPPDRFPFTTLMGAPYDSADYDKPLRRLLELVDYEALRADQAGRRQRGERSQLGIGIATYTEITAGGGAQEYAAVEVRPDGSAVVSVGTSGHGQGHATAFAMIVADRLGIPLEQVELVQSDTDVIRSGGGTGGSRSLQVGGSAVLSASDAVLAKARALAAHLLEAAEGDIVVSEDGKVGVAGVPAKALGWDELATAANSAPDLVDHEDGTVGLAAQLDFDQGAPTFPFGAHLAVVEVDTETGAIAFLRHVAVDDCGTVLNPLLVAGQQHGGIAQAAAQALFEEMVYDADGNPLTSNLADYLMPSAADLPSYEVASTETPTPLNPLGAKGIGEAGTIGATPAVQNAVVDALAHLGIRHLDMPATPERVWRAIADARAGQPPEPWREPPAVFATLDRGGATAAVGEEAGI